MSELFIGVSDLRQGFALVSGLPARFESGFAAQRLGDDLATPSLEGGCEEFQEVEVSWRSSSAIRASWCRMCSFNRAISWACCTTNSASWF